MEFPSLAADYRNFRLNRINETQYKHTWYLLFWPCLGLRYILIERFVTAQRYFSVYAPLDDLIPFQEWFILPYLMWYALIVGMHLYLYLYDIAAFKHYSRYMITAFSLSTAIFLLFPTCQQLRPEVMPRDNLLSRAVAMLYCLDTNTNVCPSEHVIGAVAAFQASRRTPCLRRPGAAAVLGSAAFLSGIATVFLKQHSVVDVAAALVVCGAVEILFRWHDKRK